MCCSSPTTPNWLSWWPAALARRGAIELFPKFTDGRAFSQAVLLRRRYRFAGDIRATGDVLIDQLVQMHRSGFSSAVLAEGVERRCRQRQFDRLAPSTRATRCSRAPLPVPSRAA
jgi:uncharacterized protein (DUF934 family)